MPEPSPGPQPAPGRALLAGSRSPSEAPSQPLKSSSTASEALAANLRATSGHVGSRRREKVGSGAPGSWAPGSWPHTALPGLWWERGARWGVAAANKCSSED